MTSSLYLRPDGTLERDLPADAMAGVLASGKGLLWLLLTAAEAKARPLLRETFGFHQLAVDDCFNGRIDTPKVDDYRSYLFIVAQSVAYLSRSDRVELSEVGIFLGRNYVVSVCQGSLPPLEALFSTAASNTQLLDRGSDFLVYHILDCIVDLLLPAVEEMDDQIDALEQRIVERPSREQLPELLLIKRNTLRLRRSILPQRDMVNRLSRGEFAELIDRESLMFFRDVYDHIVRVEELLEGLRDIADGALNSYLSAVNNRMNEIMKAMSVVAVIFLPLTLIASIYGTNLDYSSLGLRFEHGFLAMLAFMVVVAIGLVVYFRRRGWF